MQSLSLSISGVDSAIQLVTVEFILYFHRLMVGAAEMGSSNGDVLRQ